MTPDEAPDSTRHPTWGTLESPHGSGDDLTSGDEEAAGPTAAEPGTPARPLTFFGLIEYAWRGGIKTAFATPAPLSASLRMPAVVVGLSDVRVTVARPMGGTELVAWEWIRELRGWAAVPSVVQRLKEPALNEPNAADSIEAAARKDADRTGTDAGSRTYATTASRMPTRRTT